MRRFSYLLIKWVLHDAENIQYSYIFFFDPICGLIFMSRVQPSSNLLTIITCCTLDQRLELFKYACIAYAPFKHVFQLVNDRLKTSIHSTHQFHNFTVSGHKSNSFCRCWMKQRKDLVKEHITKTHDTQSQVSVKCWVKNKLQLFCIHLLRFDSAKMCDTAYSSAAHETESTS